MAATKTASSKTKPKSTSTTQATARAASAAARAKMAKSRSPLFSASSGASSKKASSNNSTSSSSKVTKPSSIAMTPLSPSAITAPSLLAPVPVPASLPASPSITPFQHRVLSALLQIPQGRVSTYGALARALHSAPRAVGGALRRNPWAPEVPCHRIVMENLYIGGFMGSITAAPSGVNCERKLQLLAGEGVRFDERGYLLDKGRVWDEFEIEE